MKKSLTLYWRNVKKSPAFFAINLLGMTVGLVAFILINYYTIHQLSFNKSHDAFDNLVRLTTKITNAGKVTHFAINAKIAAPEITDYFPEVKSFCRINSEPAVVAYDDKIFTEQSIYFADSTYDELFDLELISGSLDALSDPSSIVLTDSASQLYFGNTQSVGETIEIQSGRITKPFRVAAIVRLPPSNTSLRFDALASIQNTIETFGPSHGHLGAINSYLLLGNAASISLLEKKLPSFYEEKLGNLNGIVSYSLQPFGELYWQTDLSYDNGRRGNLDNVTILTWLSLFLLVLTVLNFMNLSTAAAFSRQKEVGVRKILGASKLSLATQAYFETFATVLLAILIATLISQFLMPWLNDFVGFHLQDAVTYLDLVSFLSIVWLVVSLISGAYLALYLANRKPLQNIEMGGTSMNANLTPKRILIALQFVVASMAISAVLIVQSQIDFMLNKNLGYQSEGLVNFIVDIPGMTTSQKQVLRDRVTNLSGVSNATLSLSQVAFEMPQMPMNMDRDSASNFQMINYQNVDANYLATFNIPILKGRAFSEGDSAKFIVNESAVEQLGFNSPETIIGETLNFSQAESSVRGQVVGVVPDFHFQSMHFEIQPLVFNKNDSDRLNFLTVALKPGDHQHILGQIESLWYELIPNSEFDYRYITDVNANQYAEEERLGQILNYTTGIIVLISALGMFGLTLFSANHKTKEIGIRKILGADVYQLILQMGKPMLILVIAGNLISLPFTYMLAKDWLTAFVYSDGIDFIAFVFAFLLSASIAIISIFYVVWRAANGNIVEALRHE
ncbi:MAG: FtsX-like permease family protein [Cyclobacteriaceae bacterium]